MLYQKHGWMKENDHVWKLSANSVLMYFQLRKDFDAEREKETEEFENSRPIKSSMGKNSSNSLSSFFGRIAIVPKIPWQWCS